MCAFKKPSTPSYGVKLFVSLVLLAISLCLVNCDAVTVVKKPVEVESAKVATDITAALNAALAKLPAKAFLEAHPTLKLSEIITALDAAKPLKPGHVAATPVTDYEFVLPHGKTVNDYVVATLKDFKIAGSDEAKIKTDLIAAFAKTIEDLKTEFPAPAVENVEIEKNLLELETLLMQNFENPSSLTKLPKSDAARKAQDTGKGLFSLMFETGTLPFEPVVYVPKATGVVLPPSTTALTAQEEFVKDCVAKVTTATPTPSFSAPRDGAKALLNSVLTNLGTKDAAKNVPVKWSEILVAMKKYGVNSSKTIDNASGTTPFVDADFKFADIADSAAAQAKFFVPFGKFDSVKGMNNDVVLVQYFINCNTPAVKGANLNEAFSALIKLVQADVSLTTLSGNKPAYASAKPVPPFFEKLTIKNDDLVKLINEALKPLAPTRTITVTVDEIKLDDKSFFTLDATTKKLKGEFPLRSDDKSTDEEIIKKYIQGLVASLDLTKSDAEIKQNFLTKFVAKESIAANEKEITEKVQAEAATAALKSTKPGEGDVEESTGSGQKPEEKKTTSADEGLPTWAWILIGIGAAGILAAIAFGVYMKVVAKKDKM